MNDLIHSVERLSSHDESPRASDQRPSPVEEDFELVIADEEEEEPLQQTEDQPPSSEHHPLAQREPSSLTISTLLSAATSHPLEASVPLRVRPDDAEDLDSQDSLEDNRLRRGDDSSLPSAQEVLRKLADAYGPGFDENQFLRQKMNVLRDFCCHHNIPSYELEALSHKRRALLNRVYQTSSRNKIRHQAAAYKEDLRRAEEEKRAAQQEAETQRQAALRLRAALEQLEADHTRLQATVVRYQDAFRVNLQRLLQQRAQPLFQNQPTVQ